MKIANKVDSVGSSLSVMIDKAIPTTKKPMIAGNKKILGSIKKLNLVRISMPESILEIVPSKASKGFDAPSLTDK